MIIDLKKFVGEERGYWTELEGILDSLDNDPEQDMALATAQIWVASAKYRENPERFLEYRDSVLTACSLSVADVRAFVDQNKNEPEKFYPYSKLMKEFIDSLLDIEDSLSAALKDSLKQVDPTIP